MNLRKRLKKSIKSACLSGLFVVALACSNDLPDGTSFVPSAEEDPTPSLPTIEFSAASSSEAENSGTVNLTVTLSEALSETATIDYAATDVLAVNGTDYNLSSGTLTFSAGETNKSIAVSIVDDALDEALEGLIVTLNNPSSNVSTGGQSTYTLSITDDDPSPSVEFNLTSSNGGEASSPALLTVDLSTASGQDVTVDYSVTGGTATDSGTDFTLASGTVTFSAGETSKDISVTITDDTLDEDDETIEVTLSNPGNATLGTNTIHTYAINDNDLPPRFNLMRLLRMEMSRLAQPISPYPFLTQVVKPSPWTT